MRTEFIGHFVSVRVAHGDEVSSGVLDFLVHLLTTTRQVRRLGRRCQRLADRLRQFIAVASTDPPGRPIHVSFHRAHRQL